MKPLNFLLTIGLFLAVLVSFISCSDNLPHVSNVVSTVFYEFNDYESKPEIRLSVFTQCDVDVRRIESMKIINDKTGYEWVCKKVELIPGRNNKFWAGYSNFISATNEDLPDGKYTVLIEDYADNEAVGYCNIRYTKNYANATAKDFPDIIRIAKVVNYALYDENDVLLYYGELKEQFDSLESLLNNYDGAVKYRICYSISSGTIVCVMPPVEVVNNINEE